MEFILSILLIIGIWWYFKYQDIKACNYRNTHNIDYGKMSEDRLMNNLSNSQVNQNILNGKYNKPVTGSNVTWEDFK